jgi:hypothetical protein
MLMLSPSVQAPSSESPAPAWGPGAGLEVPLSGAGSRERHFKVCAGRTVAPGGATAVRDGEECGEELLEEATQQLVSALVSGGMSLVARVEQAPEGDWQNQMRGSKGSHVFPSGTSEGRSSLLLFTAALANSFQEGGARGETRFLLRLLVSCNEPEPEPEPVQAAAAGCRCHCTVRLVGGGECSVGALLLGMETFLRGAIQCTPELRLSQRLANGQPYYGELRFLPVRPSVRLRSASAPIKQPPSSHCV